MSSILVINAAGPETRVALVENGTISEFYLERKKDKGIVGNIYKGKVVRVLPGMQAAFVDIGLEKAAFLYVADVAGGPDFSEEFDISETPEGEHGEAPPGDIPSEDAPDRPVEVPPLDVRAADALSEPSEPEDTPEEEASGEEANAADAAAEEPPATDVVPVELSKPDVTPEAGPTPATEVPSAEAGEAAPAQLPAEPAVDAGPVDEEPGLVEGESTAPAAPAPKEARAERPQKGQLRAKQQLEPLARKRRRENAPKKEAPKASKSAQIQDLLKEGQEVIVQVVKDPIGSKGARVTCHISLPGRHLVFMPTVDHVGISRRVENEKERRRLRELVDGLRPPGTGFIVRTVADGVDKDKLVADIKFLLGLWNEMARKKDKLRAPALLHPDLDLILRSIRDLFSAEVEKLVIDDRLEYERISQFVEQSVPQLKNAIEYYDGNEPIFDAYGIEQELQRALQRKVWLKSGGYLIMDQAEALVAVDVNSGRFVGKKNLEETITAINIEAAKEVVYQLRLRNIGGIIIIDFIDMEKQQNREKVFKALQEALQKDRAKTNIVKISELGLVEMTRKRVRESVGRLLHEPCAVCDGRGYMKSKVTIAYEIFREIQREATSRREDTIVVSCHPEVAKYVQNEEREALRNLMMRWNRTVTIQPKGSYHQEQYDLQAKWSRREDVQAKKEKERGERPEKAPQERGERAEKAPQERAPAAEKPPAPKPSAPPKPTQLEIPQNVPAPAGAVAAGEEEEGEEGEEEGPEAAAGPNGGPAQPGQPGQPGSGRRRRRRRRGRGGGGGGGQGQQQGQGQPQGGGGAPAQAGGNKPSGA